MTKYESREVSKLQAALQYGIADAGTVARSLSALQRSARTAKSAAAIEAAAIKSGVRHHPDYII